MPDKYLFYLMLTGHQVTCVILSTVVTNQNACQQTTPKYTEIDHKKGLSLVGLV